MEQVSTIIVAGPFDTEQTASDTARFLGDANHSVFSRVVKDSEGFETHVRQWFVERHLAVVAQTIVGLSWEQIRAKQAGRG